jgi:hypothetical protein
MPAVVGLSLEEKKERKVGPPRKKKTSLGWFLGKTGFGPWPTKRIENFSNFENSL